MDLTTVLIAIIAFLLGVILCFALYLIFSRKLQNSSSKQNTPSPIKRHEEKDQPQVPHKSINLATRESHCQRHDTKNAVGICAICTNAFCEECLIEHEHLHFCSQHFRTFTSKEWEIIDSIRTSPEEAQMSMYLYDFKGQLWGQEQIPMIVTTHYQINTENDQIESQISLLAPAEQKERLINEIQSYKKPS